MTTSGSDFEVAKAVADQLKGIDKERQQRILRWVSESLSLDLSALQAIEGSSSGTGTESGASIHRDVVLPQRQQRAADIKTFVDSKKPKSDVQFATVVAYYYRFEVSAESRRDSIDAQVLQDAARLAGRRRPPKPRMTLTNAKNLGYLDSPERGQFRINSVGENLVAMTLPGSEPEGRRRKGRSTRSQKIKSRKR
jgi:hypothetical protein